MNFSRFAAAALLMLGSVITHAAPVVHYRTASIEGVNVFYREAGPADAPAIVLLHGFPASSNMYRNLIPALADRYRVIAPDYPASVTAICRTAHSFVTASLTSRTSPIRC